MVSLNSDTVSPKNISCERPRENNISTILQRMDQVPATDPTANAYS